MSALKYERIDSGVDQSPLLKFMIESSLKNRRLCNYFYFFLGVECENPQPEIKAWYEEIRNMFFLEVRSKDQVLYKNLLAHMNFRGCIQTIAKDVVTKEKKAAKRTVG